jgi:hypothetical protein
MTSPSPMSGPARRARSFVLTPVSAARSSSRNLRPFERSATPPRGDGELAAREGGTHASRLSS